MGWQVDWEVIEGARGRRPGDASRRIYQGETVRFSIRVDDDDPHRIMTLADDARHWAEGPSLGITDSSTVVVRPRDGDPLTIDYRFRYSGHKRLHFSGRAVERIPAERRMTTRAPERRHAEPLFPALNLHREFEVIAEPSRGESVASTAGADGRTALRRDLDVREGRRRAAADRAEADRAEDADQAERRDRLRSGVGRDGILPRGVSPDAVQDSWTEGEFLEYARDLRAAIAVTPPLDLNGRAYIHDGSPCRGYWTWRWADDDVQFYFHATQVQRRDLVGAPVLPVNSDLQETIRARTARRYPRDAWIVGRSSLLGRGKLLFRAGELASRMSGAIIDGFIELFEIVDDIMLAFDVALFVASGGVGSILTMLRRAARALLHGMRTGTRRLATGAMRRGASRGIGTAARGLASRAEHAVEAESRLARGLGPVADEADDAMRVVEREGRSAPHASPVDPLSDATSASRPSTTERGVEGARGVPSGHEYEDDRIFAELTDELGLDAPGTTVPTGSREARIASAHDDAVAAGWVTPGGDPVPGGPVHAVVGEHADATARRVATGHTGATRESAHLGATSILRTLTGYSRSRAMTALLPRAAHQAFDQHWLRWIYNRRRAIRARGSTDFTAPLQALLNAQRRALRQVPGLSSETRNTLESILAREYYDFASTLPDGLRARVPLPAIWGS